MIDCASFAINAVTTTRKKIRCEIDGFGGRGTRKKNFISDPVIFKLCDLMCRRIEKEFASKSAHFR